MRFGHIELYVSDPTASRAFYENVLGLQPISVQGDFTWYDFGEGPHVLLRPGRAPQEEAGTYQTTAAALVLYTDDLERKIAELRERGLEFRGDDGEGCPTFTDPDGNWFQLAQPS